jgi:hypothetical protein
MILELRSHCRVIHDGLGDFQAIQKLEWQGYAADVEEQSRMGLTRCDEGTWM